MNLSFNKATHTQLTQQSVAYVPRAVAADAPLTSYVMAYNELTLNLTTNATVGATNVRSTSLFIMKDPNNGLHICLTKVLLLNLPEVVSHCIQTVPSSVAAAESELCIRHVLTHTLLDMHVVISHCDTDYARVGPVLCCSTPLSCAENNGCLDSKTRFSPSLTLSAVLLDLLI